MGISCRQNGKLKRIMKKMKNELLKEKQAARIKKNSKKENG